MVKRTRWRWESERGSLDYFVGPRQHRGRNREARAFGWPRGRAWRCLGHRPLRDLDVPEDRRGELEDALDLLAEGRRRDPLSPRDIRHLVERDPLDVLGELLPLPLIVRAHPVGRELAEPRDIRPAEPGAWTGARHAEVDGGVDHVRGQPPGMKDVPAALIGRLRVGADGEG